MFKELIKRLKYHFRFILNYSQELGRRVEIENILFSMSNGDRPLPTKKGCRILALKLGTPKEYWRKGWKNKLESLKEK